ncbi:hypothetical protein O5O45_07295 [Hahella aquimaris]|uniref:hypothetical protein n=1 Tax=Hahella sp. HNIBRBA332 TaxID=3015983 RepID=UPI00273BA282|nr:hypothetical protein [Hahella sp. HNIBRBA332]WLQ15718.1 hypothetical protein O5O45_07295 [Hahella sp. HNIBRBA332]
MSDNNYTDSDREIFKKAAEDFFAEKPATVSCDKCLAVIRFEYEGTIVKHSCDCGKFSGVLKVM